MYSKTAKNRIFCEFLSIQYIMEQTNPRKKTIKRIRHLPSQANHKFFDSEEISPTH